MPPGKMTLVLVCTACHGAEMFAGPHRSAHKLRKALGITTQQADAIVACRTKNGDFKDVDGLKNADGLDAAVLDGKKVRLRF